MSLLISLQADVAISIFYWIWQVLTRLLRCASSQMHLFLVTSLKSSVIANVAERNVAIFYIL